MGIKGRAPGSEQKSMGVMQPDRNCLKDGIRTAVLIAFAALLTLDYFRVVPKLLVFKNLKDWCGGAGILLAAFDLLRLLLNRVTGKTGRKAPDGRLPGTMFLAAFLVAGLAGNYPGLVVIPLVRYYAAFENVRFFSCAYLAYRVFRGYSVKTLPEGVPYAAALALCVTAGVILVCSAADFFLFIWPTQMRRFGIRSQQLYYGHPTNLGMACAFLLVLLPVFSEKLTELKGSERFEKLGNFLRILLNVIGALILIPLFLTLRIRFLGIAAGLPVLYFFFVRRDRHLKLWMVPVFGAGVAVLGYRRIMRHYFLPQVLNAARGAMLRASVDIARVCFPLGGGFSTFGSRMARHFYSELYFVYNLNKIQGMSPIWPSYACDSFWAMMIGETGFLGTACYLALLAWLLCLVNKKIRAASICYLGAMVLLLYEMVETSATLAFTEGNGFGFGLLLGFLLCVGEVQKRTNAAGAGTSGKTVAGKAAKTVAGNTGKMGMESSGAAGTDSVGAAGTGQTAGTKDKRKKKRKK